MLRRWPRITKNEFGQDLAGKTDGMRAQQLPYRSGRALDGVYFYDSSALERFFTSERLNAKVMSKARVATIG